MDYHQFVESHAGQLQASGINDIFWPSLFRKLAQQEFDAGEYFKLNGVMVEADESFDLTDRELKDDNLDVVEWSAEAIKSVEFNDCNAVFLIDHAWTFRPTEMRESIMKVDGLVVRMAGIIGKQIEEAESGGGVEAGDREFVLSNIWKKSQCYSLISSDSNRAEDNMPWWYVMDEFGSAIGHSDEPNVRVVPFYYIPAQASFSVLFPIKDIAENDELTRDYVEESKFRRQDLREFLLLPWQPQDFDNLPVHNDIVHPDFFVSDRNVETFPAVSAASTSSSTAFSATFHEFPLKVWAENDQIAKHLSCEMFEMVDSPEEAHILWYRSHFKEFRQLSEDHPSCMINQFPCESVITMKDLMAGMIHAAYAKPEQNGTGEDTMVHAFHPSWFATTYDLRNELPQFVSYFQNRAKLGLDNHWIVKPWNLARALDTHVTRSLTHTIRLLDGGPKIACKYLDDTVLFKRPDTGARVKMDLRFIVILRSVDPLELYVFNGFWIRFAIKPFDLVELDDYERHFTVFNYADESKILQMRCEDYIVEMERQYPAELGSGWKDSVQPKIYAAFHDLFRAATSRPAPAGIHPNPQSRAMYGIDLMLNWNRHGGDPPSMEPVILETNFMPDCERACTYYPEFADATFLTMFSSDPKGHRHAHMLTDISS